MPKLLFKRNYMAYCNANRQTPTAQLTLAIGAQQRQTPYANRHPPPVSFLGNLLLLTATLLAKRHTPNAKRHPPNATRHPPTVSFLGNLLSAHCNANRHTPIANRFFKKLFNLSCRNYIFAPSAKKSYLVLLC
jgi:hypothetical protein